jgi:hypothetical protein
MGFFKDLHAVNKMGKEINKNWDPAAQLAQAQASMAEANATMAAMTARINSTTAVSGSPAVATVTGARQTGQYVNMQPLVQLDLLVQGPGGIPSPVTITELVPQLSVHRVQPGSRVAVRVGQVPTDVVIDWEGAC